MSYNHTFESWIIHTPSTYFLQPCTFILLVCGIRDDILIRFIIVWITAFGLIVWITLTFDCPNLSLVGVYYSSFSTKSSRLISTMPRWNIQLHAWGSPILWMSPHQSSHSLTLSITLTLKRKIRNAIWNNRVLLLTKKLSSIFNYWFEVYNFRS